MNSYIKMIKWKKNDEDAKNLHENMKIKDEHEEEARLSMNRLWFMDEPSKRDRKTRVGHESVKRKMNMKKIYIRKMNMRKKLPYLWTTYNSWKKLQIGDRQTRVRHENIRRKMNIKKKLLDLWTTYDSWRSFKLEIRGPVLAEASNLSMEDSCWKKLQIWVRIMIHGRSTNNVVMRTTKIWSMEYELREQFMHTNQR